MTTVTLTDIQKHYAGHHALKDVGLSVAPGEFIVMVGPSGCGKSTLLKTIAGLESVTSGRIEIAGRDVTRADPGDRGIAMVFQSYALYPHMTVAENMGFGLRLQKRPQAEIDAAVARAATILRLEDHLDKRPKNLSGGQRQRVAIGRAITRSPDVFLFDEPLSNLDAALRTQMRVEIASLHRQLGATMIYVTHDQVEAMTMADRIVVLNAGRIEQVGAPLDLYANPVNRFVAGFLGAPRMNFVPARVVSASADTIRLTAEGLDEIAVAANGSGLRAGDALELGLRPEHLRLNGGEVRLNAVARMVEHLGRDTVLYVDAAPFAATAAEGGKGALTVQLPQPVAVPAGSPVTIGFDRADLYLFAADGRRLTPARTIL